MRRLREGFLPQGSHWSFAPHGVPVYSLLGPLSITVLLSELSLQRAVAKFFLYIAFEFQEIVKLFKRFS